MSHLVSGVGASTATCRAVAVALWALFWTWAPLAAAVHVTLLGLEGDLEQNVRATLALARENGQPSEARVRLLHRRARQEIETALQPFGFYRPVTTSRLERQEEDWRATYEVDPGEPVRIASVDVRLTGDGAQDPALAELVSRFPLAAGDVAEHAEWEAGKKSLEDLAAERGYLEAGFETKVLRVDLDRYVATAEGVFATGPRYRFGAVTFHQKVLDPALLEVYPKFRRGDPFELAPLLQLQEALAAIPAFRWVEVSPRMEAPEGLEIPIDVHLEAAPRRRWTLGAGFGTDTGARGRVALELRQLNQRGHRLVSDLRVSAREQRLAASYIVPARFPRTEVLSFSVRLAGLQPGTSESDLGSVAGRLSRNRGRWTESLGLVFQRERFEAGADSGTADLVMPEVGWTIGHADDLVYPTRGWRFQAAVRGADDSLLANVSFLQARLDGRLVRSLGSRSRVLLRGVVGHSAVDDFSRLPASLRFFAGGDASVRGFGYQELGPVDDHGRVAGGDSLVEASLEIDRLLVEKVGRWGLAAFLDAGNSLRSFSGSLERGAGLGIRWLSPVGMVRADVAAALSRPGNPLRFHLSIGPPL